MEAEYTANVIAENMYSQCDTDGNQYLLLEAIVDHRKDGHAVSKSDMYTSVGGRRSLKKTTKGWHLCVEWKDGSTSWEKLSNLKESNPIKVAEYSVARGINKEPAFRWWVGYTPKRRDGIIAAVNKGYHKQTHKFGIQVPKTVLKAQKLDQANGNTLWMDAVDLEMKNV